MKFILLVVSCLPWLVLYFFISPLWDAIATAAVMVAGCAAYAYWKKDKPNPPETSPAEAEG